MTSQEALNLLYNATRQMSLSAEQHEQLKQAAQTVLAALQAKEPEDVTSKTQNSV